MSSLSAWVRRSSRLALLILFVTLLPLTVSPPATTAQSANRCFEETGFCISGRIREYWEQNGGLPVFGLPITPQRAEVIEGQSLQVQWFERNRLELHPENAPPFDVLLGRLGADTLAAQGRDWFNFPQELEPRAGCRYFAETRQNVCGAILAAWQAQGLNLDGQPGFSEFENLALWGLPLSPLQTEVIEGREYQVQWFERARFELHPENAPPSDVLLGLLGNALLRGAEDPDASPTEPTLDPAAPRHKIAFVSDRTGFNDIYLMNTDGSDVQNLTFSRFNDRFPAWSPDATKIAFVSDRTGNPEVFVMDADGSNMYQLTFFGNAATQRPVWSPDGRRLAFAAERRGKTDIYTINLFGAGLTNLSSAFAVNESPTWSPDGTRLAFSANRENGDWEVYVMNADGTGQQNISRTPEDDRDPVWSPDGMRITFVSNRAGDWEVFVMDADGSNQRNLTNSPDDDGFPSWSPDGRAVIFHSLRFAPGAQPNYDIFIVNVDGTDIRRLTTDPAADLMPVWSPVPVGP